MALLLSIIGFSSIAKALKAANTAPSTAFRVFGRVATPTDFDLTKLKNFPATTQIVTYFAASQVTSHKFTGVLLWDLLQSVGIKTDHNAKNNILHLIIIVTGSDGYESVFGAGEIAPGFGGDQIMIAYAEDGQPLGQNGFAKIIVPGDKMGGRFVSNIIKIEVRNVEDQ